MGAQRRCLQHLMTVCDGPLEVSGELVCYDVNPPWPSLAALFNEGGKSAVQWGKTNPGQVLTRNERTLEFQVVLDKTCSFFRTSSVPFKKPLRIYICLCAEQSLWPTMFPAHVHSALFSLAFKHVDWLYVSNVSSCWSTGSRIWLSVQTAAVQDSKQTTNRMLLVFRCLCERVHLN